MFWMFVSMNVCVYRCAKLFWVATCIRKKSLWKMQLNSDLRAYKQQCKEAERGRTAKTSSLDMPRRVSESSSFYSKCPIQLPCFINERLNELREFKWPASEFILGKELNSHRSFAPGELPHSALLCSDICSSQDSCKIVHLVQPEPKGFHQCSAWPPGWKTFSQEPG